MIVVLIALVVYLAFSVGSRYFPDDDDDDFPDNWFEDDD